VDVPAVSAAAPQTIWMYYGNEKAPASGNGQQVFDPDYTLVYHFAEANAPARHHRLWQQCRCRGAAVGRLGDRPRRAAGRGPLPLPASASLAQEAGAPLTVSAWIKPGSNNAAQAIYARRDGASELVLGIENRVPFVQLNGQRSTPAQPIPEGQWAHVALTAEKGALQLYLNGRVAPS
jgi:biopolymer transport protein ExbB